MGDSLYAKIYLFGEFTSAPALAELVEAVDENLGGEAYFGKKNIGGHGKLGIKMAIINASQSGKHVFLGGYTYGGDVAAIVAAGIDNRIDMNVVVKGYDGNAPTVVPIRNGKAGHPMPLYSDEISISLSTIRKLKEGGMETIEEIESYLENYAKPGAIFTIPTSALPEILAVQVGQDDEEEYE